MMKMSVFLYEVYELYEEHYTWICLIKESWNENIWEQESCYKLPSLNLKNILKTKVDRSYKGEKPKVWKLKKLYELVIIIQAI